MRILIAALFVSALPLRASAQSLPELVEIVKNVQAQTDALRARTDGAASPGACDAVAKTCSWIDAATVYLDSVQVPGETTPPRISAMLIGWAFKCGPQSLSTAMLPTAGTLDVLIDGLPVHSVFAVTAREDVSIVFAPWCGELAGPPVAPGVRVGPIALTSYAVGPHSLQLRLTDSASGRVQKSNIVTVTR
jgi:hypothetical protein